MEKILFFFAFIWSSSECNNITWIPQTWTQANSSCINSQQNLRILKDLDTFNNLTMAINITGDVILWIGGKERRKFFIWNNDHSKLVGEPIGCFQSDIKLSEQFEENQPTFCMSYCQHRLRIPFAGMSGKHCICYHDLYNVVQVKDRKCYTPCPGDGNYICGSPNMTTIYRSNDSIKWYMYEPGNAGKREDCVLVTEDTEQQHVWYPDKCRHQNQYICRIFDKTICKFKVNSAPPCYFKSVEKTSWFEAVRKCTNMGGYLAGKDLLQHSKLSYNGTSLWTSLNRVRQRWTDGTTIHDLLPRSESSDPKRTGCLSLRKEDDNWTIQPRPCKERHGYICSSEVEKDSIVNFQTYTNATRQEHMSFYEIIIAVIAGVSGVGSFLFIFVLCYCRCKRKRRNKTPASPLDHFYFVLEKENVYNTISVNSHGHVSTVVNTSTETHYDVPAFEGTVQYSERQKSISGSKDVDYFVYNRTSDINNDYDMLNFNIPTHNTCVTTDEYFKLSMVNKQNKCDIENNNCGLQTGTSV